MMSPRRILAALHHDSRGTALTEFVITLPIFIMVFVAISHLWKLEQMSTRTRMRAATTMWDQAMSVANGGMLPEFSRGLPQIAAVDAMSEITSYPSFGAGADAAALMKNAGLAASGSKDESEMVSSFVSGAPGSHPPYGSDFARNMTKDDFGPHPLPLRYEWYFLPFLPAGILSFNPATRHALAIGTRYGLAGGHDSDSVTLSGKSFSFEAHYDVLVAPVSATREHEWIVVGFSRLAAEQSSCLSSVLEITGSPNLDC